MTFKLTDEEYAVFNAIKEQRKKSVDPSFTYDLSQGQKYLNESGNILELNIQFEIIKKLAEKKIIDLDWIVKKDVPNKIDGTKFWLNENKDWAQDLFKYELLFSYNENHQNICFIQLNSAIIKAIDEDRKQYEATLSIDGWPRLIVECLGQEYKIPCTNDGSRQHKIISYAMLEGNVGRFIEKEELNKMLKKEGLDEIKEKESISTSIFDTKGIIKCVFSPFIKLRSREICIHKTALLTQNELDLIKKTVQNY